MRKGILFTLVASIGALCLGCTSAAVSSDTGSSGFYGTRAYVTNACPKPEAAVLAALAAAVLPQLVSGGVDLMANFANNQSAKYVSTFSATANDNLYIVSASTAKKPVEAKVPAPRPASAGRPVVANAAPVKNGTGLDDSYTTDYTVQATPRCIVVQRGYFKPKPPTSPAAPSAYGINKPVPSDKQNITPDQTTDADIDFSLTARIETGPGLDPPVFYLRPVELLVNRYTSSGSSVKDYVVTYQFKVESRDDSGKPQEATVQFALPAFEKLGKGTHLGPEVLASQVSNLSLLPGPGPIKIGAKAGLPYSVTIKVSETDDGIGKQLWSSIADVLTQSKSGVVKAVTGTPASSTAKSPSPAKP